MLACPAGELADAASAHGFEVQVLGIDRGQRTGSLAGLLRLAGAVSRARSEVRAVARGRRVAVVHVHHPMSAIQAAGAAREAGAPMLVHLHETLPIGRAYRFAMGRTRALGRLFVGVSEASCAMARAVGVAPDRVRLLHNAVDPRFVGAIEAAADLSGPGPKFGLFGVLEPRKGHEDFCAPPPWWRPRCRRPRLDRRRAELRRERGVRRPAPGAGAGTRHLGPRALHRLPPRRANLMAGMDCVVLASTGFESLPTVLIEACALGRPVVATDIGGVREIVRDGDTGLVVSPHKPVALAAAMRRAVSADGAASLP